jgi:hypothetical protein
MRNVPGVVLVATLAFLAQSTPVLAGDGGQSQSATAAKNPDDGWRAVIYPVYGWLPIYGADVRLPDAPEGSTDATLQQAFLAAFRIEKGSFALEGCYLFAGLSGEAETPSMKLEVDTQIADLRAGFAVVPDLYLEAGARYLALDMEATIGDSPAATWNPDLLEPVIGITYRPLLGKQWRFILHGDVSGLATGDSTTATGTAKLEWQPANHFLLVAGVTVQYLSTEGSIGSRDVKLEQTLYGPIIGFGIPF